MNKIAQYLNSHVIGEVSSNSAICQAYSNDGSILKIEPEVVAWPRATNDIRKILRFTWQMADKGHSIPVTVRGGGSNQTGAAIGKGIVIDMSKYLSDIIFINLKNKDQFVHGQAGVNFNYLNSSLNALGVMVPSSAPGSSSTIGGLIAENYSGKTSGKYGPIGSQVSRLEVVLANGDIIETGRISKSELNKKKGLQTLEGEIYRRVDGFIEDYQEIITGLSEGDYTDVGYSGIAKVKQKDGSFDLTPLFIGSQGTLGIITEAVVRLSAYNPEIMRLAITFKDSSQAFEFNSSINKLQPSVSTFLDPKLFEIAKSSGKKPLIPDEPKAILYLEFDDTTKLQAHKLKHLKKKLAKLEESKLYTSKELSDQELLAIGQIDQSVIACQDNKSALLPLVDGATVPGDRISEFLDGLGDFSKKHYIEPIFSINLLNNIIHLRFPIQMHSVSERQKSLKVIEAYAEFIKKCGGSFIVEAGEGRLKASATYKQLDKTVLELFDEIRKVFDPYKILNPGVKQASDINSMAAILDHEYNPNNYINGVQGF